MDYKQLQSFVEVVERKSFSAAAEKLKISQPTISTHVKNLEEELNAHLIIRTARNLELTPKGMELYECSKNIMRLWDNLVEQWQGNGINTIHIGASTIPSAYILPEVIPAFGENHEDVYFEVNQGDSQEIINAIRKGIYDIGLVGMKTEEDSLRFQKFYQDKLIVITPVKEKFLAMKSVQSNFPKESLLKEPFILREDGSGSRKNAANLLGRIGISEDDLQVVARVNDQETIKNLVSGGLGVSIISEKAVENYLSEGRLLSFDIPGSETERDLYVICQKDYIIKDYIKLFIDYLFEFYKGKEEES